MKKRLFICVLICVLMAGTGALAETAQERIEHLKEHGKKAVFSCSGSQVKLRVAPGANRMHGRSESGDRMRILDSFGEWVYVEIVETAPGNEEARRGMTGWIHVDHVACACDPMLETE